jgi:hypothetical protein
MLPSPQVPASSIVGQNFQIFIVYKELEKENDAIWHQTDPRSSVIFVLLFSFSKNIWSFLALLSHFNSIGNDSLRNICHFSYSFSLLGSAQEDEEKGRKNHPLPCSQVVIFKR